MPRAQLLYPGLVLVLLATQLGCSGETPADESPEWTPASSATELHAIRIVAPASSGALTTDAVELSGEAVGIACATCHGSLSEAPSIAERAANARPAGEDRTMHTEIALVHGTLTCASCHVTSTPDTLHIAGGESFPIADSMRLCSQCHGLIRKAYDHGAHGGMRGYWDLKRGPRERNTCIACHNPHSPAHPQVIPVPGPKDKRVYRRQHEGSMIEQRFGKDTNE